MWTNGENGITKLIVIVVFTIRSNSDHNRLLIPITGGETQSAVIYFVSSDLPLENIITIKTPRKIPTIVAQLFFHNGYILKLATYRRSWHGCVQHANMKLFDHPNTLIIFQDIVEYCTSCKIEFPCAPNNGPLTFVTSLLNHPCNHKRGTRKAWRCHAKLQ